MTQLHFSNATKGRASRSHSLLATAIGVCLAVGLTCRAEAQTYQLTNIGVINGAAFSFPRALDDRGGLIRVIGTSQDKFGNSTSCWYWDSTLPAGSPVAIGLGTPNDVNGQGQVVGSSGDAAFCWTRTGGLVSLPFPSTTPDGTGPFLDAHVRTGNAVSINEAGVVSGNIYREDLGVLSVCWQKVGAAWQVQYLKPLPGSLNAVNNSSSGEHINEAGDIAGSVNSTTQASVLRAVVWKNLGTPSSPLYDAPTDAGLPSEGEWPESSGGLLNNSSAGAQVLGSYRDAAAALHRLLWTPGSAPVSFDAAGPNALSDDGAVTGWTYAFAGGAQRAYYYKNGTLTDCGSLGGGTSYGYDVNSAGEVVGQSKTTRNSATYAFVWKAGVMKNLGGLVNGGLGPFSRLTNARKISNGGTVVGEGITSKGGYSQSYVLRKVSP